MARINEIQAALENYSSRGLMRLEARLRNELEIVMGQEEILWLQKSRKDQLLHFEGSRIELRPFRIIRGIGCTMRKIYGAMQLGTFLPYLKVKLQFIKITIFQNFFQFWMLMILIVLLAQFWGRKLKELCLV